jgi:hypothetical protein
MRLHMIMFYLKPFIHAFAYYYYTLSCVIRWLSSIDFVHFFQVHRATIRPSISWLSRFFYFRSVVPALLPLLLARFRHVCASRPHVIVSGRRVQFRFFTPFFHATPSLFLFVSAVLFCCSIYSIHNAHINLWS